MAEMTYNRNSNLYQEDLASIVSSIPWQKIQGKSIAVTGATGLIGTQIIDTLMYLNGKYGANIRIVAMGRNPDRVQHRFSEYDASKELEFQFFESSSVFPNLKVDYIVHCAGNSHPKAFADDPVGTLLGNIKGAENVLRRATEINASVLILSSGEVYGENKSPDKGMDEDYTGELDLSNCRSCYTEGKRAVESLCQSFIQQYGTSVKIARPCRIFGPTMTAADNKASAQFLKNGKMGLDIILKSDGTQLFSYIYSADAVSALLKILIDGKVGQAYNVSAPSCNVRLKDFASEVAIKSGVNLIMSPVGEAGGSKVCNALLDNARLVALGWMPHYDNIGMCIERTLKILEIDEN